MKEEELNDFKGKKVFVVLRNNFHYTAEILSSGEEFVKIKDKFGGVVLLNIDEIKSIEEVRE